MADEVPRLFLLSVPLARINKLLNAPNPTASTTMAIMSSIMVIPSSLAGFVHLEDFLNIFFSPCLLRRPNSGVRRVVPSLHTARGTDGHRAPLLIDLGLEIGNVRGRSSSRI